MKPYTQAVKAKGYTLKAIGARWGLKDRQMAYISAKPKQRDWDALSGLPKQEKDND